MKAFQTEVLWSRIGAAVDEAAFSLMRTAFSGIVRDSRDFACGLFDARGRLLAQDSVGTPGLAGALPGTLRFILEQPRAKTLVAGDVLITNDPWGATGHLLDTTLLTPLFFKGQPAGYAVCAAHKIDIGGRGMTAEARDVHEEGLWLPVLKLMEAGEPNRDVWDLIGHNVRARDMVVGDLHAQLASNDICGRQLELILREIGIEGVIDLAEAITARTEASTRAAIRAVPNGSYTAAVDLDPRPGRTPGTFEPVQLVAAVLVDDEVLTVDYAGTSPQVSAAVNSPFNGLTLSYTLMALKSVLDPHVPINEGFMRAINVTAPSGCILNPTFPAGTNSRGQIAHFIPELLFTALLQAVPEKVLAPSGTVPAWNQQIEGTWADGRRYAHSLGIRGGLGARPDRDGISSLSFPANLSTLPVELLEADAPVIIERKEFLRDSAGAGRFRGGCGQQVTLKVLDGDLAPFGPLHFAMGGGRFDFGIPGFQGGGSAPLGSIDLNGTPIRTGAIRTLSPGDRVTYKTPGGGGFFPAWQRDPLRVADDVRNGYVSAERARDLYGVVLDGACRVDDEATTALRSRLSGETSSAHESPAADLR